MKPSINQSLIDASDALEHLLDKLPTLSMADKVDIAARNRAIAKNSKALDDAIKDEIKDSLKHKPGVKLGEVFKAVLKLIPCERLDQKALKEEKPAIYAAYVKGSEDERVTFEPR